MDHELLLIRNQIDASRAALGKESVSDRKTMATSHFAADFNRLLGLCKARLSEIDPARWPAELATPKASMGPSLSHTTIAEVRAYLAQLVKICDQNLKDHSIQPRRFL
ncbi:hypothetical protein [Burkholderia vietnamiensis]|uniref:hypothetical protein n=1 Tax=Burkholderia vietnamiensis TaxID=60552 RepID=UPI001CF519FB|nr:hypothetical protein [Burkholderia vietnamiensis]MCA8073192.1 hypothetical protein [Burkholderia vietnamiensis]MDN8067295.1 hypothetical protein [Burkholderia vietnamiensis]